MTSVLTSSALSTIDLHKTYLMKKLLPIALLLLTIGTDIHAQNTKQAKIQTFRENILKTIPINTGGSNKTTGIYWRVASAGNYAFDGTSLAPSDSSRYIYSNARGSAFSSSSDLVLEDYGLEAEVMFDTAYKFQNNGSGLEFSNRYLGAFNSKNERTAFTVQMPGVGGITNSNEHRADLDANGNITKETYYTWNVSSSQWVASGATEHMYNGQNQRVKDSSYSISTTGNTPISMSIYTYDSNGDQEHMLMLMWNGSGFDSSRQAFSTYTNNQVVSVTEQYYDNNQWINSSFDTTGYNTAGIYNYNEYREWDTANKEWVNVDLETRIIDSKDLPVSAAISEWDNGTKQWNKVADAELTYNNNDLPIRLDVFIYLGGIKLPSPYYISNIYYEHYFDVGIDETTTQEKLNVYPNPASSTINVVLDGRRDASITLVNMTGQTLRSLNLATNTQNAVIDITGVPAGNYILNLTSSNMAPARRKVTIQ